MMPLSNQEKSAIAQMLQYITSTFYPSVDDYKIFHYFSNLGISYEEYGDSSVSPTDYFDLLRNLNDELKRDILQYLYMFWVDNGERDKLPLYNTFNTLIYLNVCNAPEYFLMDAIIGLLTYFGLSNLVADYPTDSSHYSLFSARGDINDRIDLEIGDDDIIMININGNVIQNKTPYYGNPAPSQVQPILDEILNQRFKTHNRSIVANCQFECNYMPYSEGALIINLFDLSFYK